MNTTSDWVRELRQRGLTPKTLTPEERAEKEKADAERITKAWQAQERVKYQRMSLWGETETRFLSLKTGTRKCNETSRQRVILAIRHMQ